MRRLRNSNGANKVGEKQSMLVIVVFLVFKVHHVLQNNKLLENQVVSQIICKRLSTYYKKSSTQQHSFHFDVQVLRNCKQSRNVNICLCNELFLLYVERILKTLSRVASYKLCAGRNLLNFFTTKLIAIT